MIYSGLVRPATLLARHRRFSHILQPNADHVIILVRDISEAILHWPSRNDRPVMTVA